MEPQGPASSAPLVLLVHGLGGTWWVWHNQLRALSAAGYHAVAVDLRGHGDSDKPPRGYDPWTLASDITGLIRALGYTTAILVGSGEGGYVCWTAAYLRPNAVSGVVAIAAPHPLAMRTAVIHDRKQRKAILPWLLWNQVPRRPERKLVAHNAAAFVRLVEGRASRKWVDSSEGQKTIRILRTAIQIPKVSHLSLEPQRWMFRSQFRLDGRAFRHRLSSRLHRPVLAIVGQQDTYIRTETVAASSKWATKLSLVVVGNSGHYPHMEVPNRVSDEIIGFAREIAPAEQ